MTRNDYAMTDKRIVVGVDGSPSSIDALRWAARVGGALGIEIAAVTAWDYPLILSTTGTAGLDWRPDTDAEKALDAAVTSAYGATRPEGLVTLLRRGHPARVLLDASDNAEMLVVGSRGHGGFVGLLLGSVSAHCAELATCPVVVLHDKMSDAA